MKELFEAILYQPIFNGFVGLYHLIPDIGVVIILITIIIKLALFPLTSASIKAQKSMTDLQPKLDELKKKFKDNQQAMAQETMKLYKEHKVNPFGSCLPILIQLPIFLAIYWVLRDGLANTNFNLLYSFIPNPENINPIAFGFVDLGKGNIVLAALAAAAQFWQAKMMITKKPPKEAGEGGKDESMMVMMNKQMLYFMPALTLFIGWQLPGGLALYWFVSTLLTALQQVFVFNKKTKKPKDENIIEGTVL